MLVLFTALMTPLTEMQHSNSSTLPSLGGTPPSSSYDQAVSFRLWSRMSFATLWVSLNYRKRFIIILRRDTVSALHNLVAVADFDCRHLRGVCEWDSRVRLCFLQPDSSERSLWRVSVLVLDPSVLSVLVSSICYPASLRKSA